MVWSPSIYMTFGEERTRPAVELVARIRTEHPEHVIDLGCGPGNSTAVLAARWPNAKLEGLDSSPDMLAQARKSQVRAEWIQADLASWSAQAKYSVIFSNATLQWLESHETLIPRLLGFLEKGGTLAFQVPHNMDAPSHQLMRETAASGPWASKLKNVREVAVLSPVDYFEIFSTCGARSDIWETEYLHVLEGEDAVYKWVSATGLRPFVQTLADDERAAFIADYKRKLNRAYPRQDGKTLFLFKRLFVVAQF
ncbi:MAG TPA: trans-aconitate 2-methyltransferase [Rhizomicrobium sp.]|nr:trans-aconitate 2-methyltransferase [Rhizomicrobium sp.]